MSELSVSLKADLALHLYGQYQMTFSILRTKPANFIAWIGPKLQPFIAAPGDYVQYANVLALDMFWVVSGLLDGLSEDLTLRLFTVGPGDTFGETAVMGRAR